MSSGNISLHEGTKFLHCCMLNFAIGKFSKERYYCILQYITYITLLLTSSVHGTCPKLFQTSSWLSKLPHFLKNDQKGPMMRYCGQLQLARNKCCHWGHLPALPQQCLPHPEHFHNNSHSHHHDHPQYVLLLPHYLHDHSFWSCLFLKCVSIHI